MTVIFRIAEHEWLNCDYGRSIVGRNSKSIIDTTQRIKEGCFREEQIESTSKLAGGERFGRDLDVVSVQVELEMIDAELEVVTLERNFATSRFQWTRVRLCLEWILNLKGVIGCAVKN